MPFFLSPLAPSLLPQCFDGQNDLFSATALNLGVNDPSQGALITVEVADELGRRSFDVVVRYIKDVDVCGGIASFLQGGGEMPQEALRLLDSLMRHRRYHDPRWLPIGRCFMDSQTQQSLGTRTGLCMMTGYQQSVRLTQSGVHLICARSALSFVKAGPVISIASEAVGVDLHRIGSSPQGLQRGSREWKLVKRVVKGMKARPGAVCPAPRKRSKDECIDEVVLPHPVLEVQQ